MKKIFFALLFAVLVSLPLSAMARDLTGAGASFPYPIYSSWAFNYEKSTGSKVNYQSVGSGTGIKQAVAGTVDFGASDDPLTTDDLKKDSLMQFPAVLGGVVAIVNIDGVETNKLVLSGPVLADIFLGKITKWNDPSITALNQGLKLPDADITMVYRSDSSGTSAIFTNYLASVSNEWKDSVGAGKTVNWPGKNSIGAKGNDGVSGSVKRVKNSIGYVEYAYAHENKISWSSLVNKNGKTVEPSLDSFTAAADNADWDRSKSYYLWLVNADGDKSWPIAAATYILIKTDNKDTIAEVTKFFEWCFTNGDTEAKNLMYVPLPQTLKDDIRGYWKTFL
ncbi:MAG: phosphate ABC transporter substrate-binding protein PstS [Deltaproteobacteria bacterium]|jgi:phosphate transport system substrate-binding protein|nr:phosphate ABC transporter substrate-binding protein PstS [Deltaproteobacteria bacterium]